jgi:DNA-directed RNA polymerase specialized sigma24 family protein
VAARVLEESAQALREGARARAGDVVLATTERVLGDALADQPGQPMPVWAELHPEDLGKGESEGVDRLEVVGGVVDALSPLERKVLLLSLVEGHRLAHVADDLGLDVEIVLDAKERALRRVRAAAHGPVPERALYF